LIVAYFFGPPGIYRPLNLAGDLLAYILRYKSAATSDSYPNRQIKAYTVKVTYAHSGPTA